MAKKKKADKKGKGKGWKKPIPVKFDKTQLAVGTNEFVRNLFKDIYEASENMQVFEARFLVDTYYILQEQRKAAQNRKRSAGKEPVHALDVSGELFRIAEGNIKGVLDRFSNRYNLGRWMRMVHGIGPVIAAGVLANFDIRPRQLDDGTIQRPWTAGSFWSFAGIPARRPWVKGEPRPYSAAAKQVAFKIGHSFVMTQNHEGDIYGKLFAQRKLYEKANNESGKLADQAARQLKEKNYSKKTVAYKMYKQGLLPDDHIQQRARRWVAKYFLSHVHHAMYLEWYGEEPAAPYAFSGFCNGQHTHYMPPPNLPLPTEYLTLRDLYRGVEVRLPAKKPKKKRGG